MEVRETAAVYADFSELSVNAAPPGYKQTEVGVVPDDWNLAKLGDYATFRTGPFGSALHRSDYVEDGIPVINPMQIVNGRIFPTASMAVTEAAAGKLAEFRLAAGVVIIGRRGEMGRCALVRPEQAGWLCGTGSMIVRAKPSLDAGFIQRVLSSPPIISAIENASVGSTMINLNQGTLANLRVTIPPLKAEQEAIAEALSDADALIESLEQLIAKKRQIKQGTMQALLTGKQRLPGYSAKWKAKRLGNLGSFLKGRGVTKDQTLSGSLSCIRYGEIYTKHDNYIKAFFSWISSEVASSATRLRDGDLLFAGSGETKEDIGKCVAFVGKAEAYAGGDIVILRSDDVDPLFLGYYLNIDLINVQKASKGQGDAVVHISADALASIDISIPQRDEQTAIASILTDMDTELAELETRLAKTRRLKQGMMQELLTGRIRLVRPVSTVVPLPKKRKEPQAAASKPHNQQINEAVVIAALTKNFGSEDWPLARVRRTKLAYLLHRHAEGRADGFLKKAAGPYDPRVRYKGPEGIALKKSYVRACNNGKYEGFVASENIAEAEAYFEKWYGADVMAWLEQFHLRRTEELELLTTVDMAVEDLRREGRSISVDAVKQLIHDHPEWKPKLDRPAFSDAAIAGALAECQTLFAS